MTRLILPLLFGLAGAAVLAGLGTWQLQRLGWKQAVLADISARVAAAPVALPATADPQADRLLAVQVAGQLTGKTIRVLASRKQQGPGYREIAVLETPGGRRVLVDRGFAPLEAGDGDATAHVEITGNLHWPQETDSFTPAPDTASGLWFARDVPAMAKALETEPLLIVARDILPADPVVVPWPVGTEGVPNDHLEYAITWFSLCVVWLGMTGLWLWRIRRRHG